MKIFFLLFAMVLIASFPFLSNFLTNRMPESKHNIEKIIEEYIISNPKKIVDSIHKMQKEEGSAEMQEHFEKVFNANKDLIISTDYPHIKAKNENSIVIVEFFDYACGYCKHMKNVISEIIKDKNVTLIFRDFPILGEGSMLASKFALAVNMVDKERYLDFHLALLSTNESYTHESLMVILKDVLADDSKVKQVVHILENEPNKVEQLINNTYELTNKIGIKGTPVFIVDKQLHIGFLSKKDLDVYIKGFGQVK